MKQHLHQSPYHLTDWEAAAIVAFWPFTLLYLFCQWVYQRIELLAAHTAHKITQRRENTTHERKHPAE